MANNEMVVASLAKVLTDFKPEEISMKLETPKSSEMGDVAFPTSTLR